MRLEPIVPDQMEPDVRAFHDEMSEDINAGFKGFRSFDERGALVGPSNPFLHHPRYGRAARKLTMAVTNNARLPRNVMLSMSGELRAAAMKVDSTCDENVVCRSTLR